MILQVYSIYDSAVKAYQDPFYMHSEGQAIRAFSDTVNNEKSLVHSHPEDFVLFYLGTYDDQTGKFQPPADQTPVSVTTALSVVKPTQLNGVSNVNA